MNNTSTPATVVSQVSAWLNHFANVLSDDKGRVGVLKIYAKEVPARVFNGVTFERIVRHTGMPADIVRHAIGSLYPKAGTGKNVHVIIRTPEREENDRQEAEELRRTYRNNQNNHRDTYWLAAGARSSSMPAFELEPGTVLETETSAA